MSWKATLQLDSEIVEVIVDGNDLMFFDVSSGQITGLTGINYNKCQVLEEFPDLENDNEWKKKAIERLKEYIKKIDNEEDKMNYIIEDLKKFGYECLYIQRSGFRPKKYVPKK